MQRYLQLFHLLLLTYLTNIKAHPELLPLCKKSEEHSFLHNWPKCRMPTSEDSNKPKETSTKSPLKKFNSYYQSPPPGKGPQPIPYPVPPPFPMFPTMPIRRSESISGPMPGPPPDPYALTSDIESKISLSDFTPWSIPSSNNKSDHVPMPRIPWSIPSKDYGPAPSPQNIPLPIPGFADNNTPVKGSRRSCDGPQPSCAASQAMPPPQPVAPPMGAAPQQPMMPLGMMPQPIPSLGMMPPGYPPYPPIPGAMPMPMLGGPMLMQGGFMPPLFPRNTEHHRSKGKKRKSRKKKQHVSDTDSTDSSDTESDTDTSSETDTETDTSSDTSTSSDTDSGNDRKHNEKDKRRKKRKHRKRSRNQRKNIRIKRNRRSNSNRKDTVSPIIQLVTNDGYVVFEKEISKSEAKSRVQEMRDEEEPVQKDSNRNDERGTERNKENAVKVGKDSKQLQNAPERQNEQNQKFESDRMSLKDYVLGKINIR